MKPKNVGHFCNALKSGQSKQWPNRRKFAQSAHPTSTLTSEVFWESTYKLGMLRQVKGLLNYSCLTCRNSDLDNIIILKRLLTAWTTWSRSFGQFRKGQKPLLRDQFTNCPSETWKVKPFYIKIVCFRSRLAFVLSEVQFGNSSLKRTASELPDGIFSNQKSNFWSILEGLAMEDVGIFGPFCLFYGQMIHFMSIWYILWSFWYIFPVLVCCTEKNLATLNCISSDFFPVRILRKVEERPRAHLIGK
jgi:hypothetical protein